MNIGSIEGDKILIKRKRISIFLNRGVKISSLIKGEKVELEHVNCPLVIGKNVKIGKGCIIDLVQYSDTIEISHGARVERTEKL
ncbi:MAG: hypothetical protein IKC74_02945 [Clostridia bacterium]|nr:hypothetical protein [Clostridia bacterium]